MLLNFNGKVQVFGCRIVDGTVLTTYYCIFNLGLVVQPFPSRPGQVTVHGQKSFSADGDNFFKYYNHRTCQCVREKRITKRKICVEKDNDARLKRRTVRCGNSKSYAYIIKMHTLLVVYGQLWVVNRKLIMINRCFSESNLGWDCGVK